MVEASTAMRLASARRRSSNPCGSSAATLRISKSIWQRFGTMFSATPAFILPTDGCVGNVGRRRARRHAPAGPAPRRKAATKSQPRWMALSASGASAEWPSRPFADVRAACPVTCRHLACRSARRRYTATAVAGPPAACRPGCARHAADLLVSKTVPGATASAASFSKPETCRQRTGDEAHRPRRVRKACRRARSSRRAAVSSPARRWERRRCGRTT